MKRTLADRELVEPTDWLTRPPKISRVMHHTLFETLPNEMLSHLLCFADRKTTCILFHIDDFRLFETDPTFWKRKVCNLPSSVRFDDSPLPPQKRYDELEALYGRFEPEIAKEYLNPVSYNQRVGYYYGNTRKELYIPIPGGLFSELECASVGYFAWLEDKRSDHPYTLGGIVRSIVGKDISKVVKSKYGPRSTFYSAFLQRFAALYGTAAIFYYILNRYPVYDDEEGARGVVAISLMSSMGDIVLPGISRSYAEYKPLMDAALESIRKGTPHKVAIVAAFDLGEQCTECRVARSKCAHYEYPVPIKKPFGDRTYFYHPHAWT